jgi:6-phosphogluconolactonase (cycloisomerase 2 family)
MSAFILHRVFGLGVHGRRGPAGAFLLILTGLVAACGGGGGGGGAAPMVTLTSIAITPASPSIALGTTTQLAATGTYSDGTKKDLSSQVTWASATATVATIGTTTGLATSVAVGTSAITATLSGVTGNDTLTVTAATVVSIAITPAKPTIAPGKTLPFTATGTYTDKTTKDLTTSVAWTSTNSAVAAIGPTTGLASAVGVGTTMIGGAYTGGPAITAVTLTVNATVYAYATNFNAGTVSQYMIGSMGALSALTPATVAAGASPFSVSAEPSGEFVYVANYNANTVSQYAIGAGGVLSPVGTGAVMTGSHPNGVTIDPANKHAYVANFGDNTVSQYSIDTTGALTPMSTPTVPTGSFPASIVISPNGKYAYVADFACSGPGCAAAQGTVSQYTVGTDGALTPMSPAAVNTGSATSQPNSLIVDPTSAYLYVANAGDNTVSQFNIGASGALTLAGAPVATGGTYPFSVTVDPTGKYVYVANTGSVPNTPVVAGTISQFSIGALGVLTPIAPGSVAAGLGVSSVTVDPTGAYAYATNRGESSLSQYTIGLNGALMPMSTPTVAAGTHPTSIATGY